MLTPVNEKLCYLCGKPLGDERTDPDHVPPKQFYPARYRKNTKVPLPTLDVHRACHEGWGADEQYAVQSLGPLAHGTAPGNALMDDNIKPTLERMGYGARIGSMVLGEFERTWNGIWLPPGTVAKRFDPERVYRVLWKIHRGLMFREDGSIFPERHYCGWKIYTEKAPPNRDDPVWRLLATPELGEHPDVLRYWKLTHAIDGRNYHARALLLWNSLMFCNVFHDAGCDCERCSAYRRGEGDGPFWMIKP
jgi:hypothetical protein